MKIVYVAGKYRAATPQGIKHNIRVADRVGERIVGDYGAMVLVPHKNTEHYEGLQDDQFFLDGTLELMRRCDCVFLCPGWEQSVGARGEKEEAERLGMPVFTELPALGEWLESSE